jgi:hypothetical protein
LHELSKKFVVGEFAKKVVPSQEQYKRAKSPTEFVLKGINRPVGGFPISYTAIRKPATRKGVPAGKTAINEPLHKKRLRDGRLKTRIFQATLDCLESNRTQERRG